MLMILHPALIFVVCVVINLILKLITPRFGAFRRGIDTVLFCSIVIGFTAGPVQGAIYGALIAMTYYIFRSIRWDYAFFVIPINMVIGFLAGLFNNMDLFLLGNILFILYHILTFIAIGMIMKRAEMKYGVFIFVNYITTIILLKIAEFIF